MAKQKTIVGLSVVYLLTAEDARALNEKRNPERPELKAGDPVAFKISEDHGGDNASGVLAVDGFYLEKARVNRGPSVGQWDFRKRVIVEDTQDPTP